MRNRNTLPPDTPPDFNGPEPTTATTETTADKSSRELSWLSQLEEEVGQRVAVYGTGGIGKSSLAALAPDPILYVDVENRMVHLKGKVKRKVALVRPDVWPELLAAITNCPAYAEIKTVVIDSLTRAEELCLAHVLATVTTEKGAKVSSIEGYGYGKGFTHLYEEFNKIFRLLDAHIALGRNVVLICHDCVTTAPNPAGDDWQRWEPRLAAPGSGKNSLRHKLKEWVDHLLFLSYDVTVDKDGKANGQGSRTIWPLETPWHMAKSVSLVDPIPFTEGNDELWKQLSK